MSCQGNSFTYYNDLPSMVAEMALADGFEYEYDKHLEGGWSWERHAASIITMNKIKQDKWDVVILQEYSTRPAYPEADVCRQSVPYLDQLVAAVMENNPDSKIQLYLTWGRPGGEPELCQTMSQFCSYETYQVVKLNPNDKSNHSPLSFLQDALTSGYMSFTCRKKPAKAAPVGEGFRNVKAMFGDSVWEELYVPGDKHPSLAGSYLSALTHFMSLYDLEKISDNVPDFGLSEEWVTRLIAAAEATRSQQEWAIEAGEDCDEINCQEF